MQGRSPVWLLSALLVVSACDSSKPEGPDAEVRQSRFLPDMALEVDAEPQIEDLASYFQANPEAGALSFAADLLDGGGLEMRVSGTMLSIRPIAEGDATLRVVAHGENGGMASDTFVVRTIDPCPAGTADTGVAFPVAVGMRWVYDLSTYRKPTSQTATRSAGRVQVDVLSNQPCQGGSQDFHLRVRRVERFEREVYNPSTNGVEWVADQDSTESEQMTVWTVADRTVTTDAADLSCRGICPPPPFGREAPRFWKSDTYSVGTGFGPFVTYRRGIGPTRYDVRPLFGTAGQASEVWEYRDE